MPAVAKHTETAARRYDVVIVGASFAGLVAARTAAMRGLSVAVLEAKPDVASRVATTGILVKEAAEEIDIPHWLTRRVHGVRLYGPSLAHVDLFAPGYFFLTTDTGRLLGWLAAEAQRTGARLLLGARFEGAERHGEIFRFKGLNIEARYILGADGARSAVARCFGLGRNTRFLVGLEQEYEGLGRTDPRFLHCFLDSRIAPGYLAWVAPGPAVTQVGLAVTRGRKADLPAFLAHTRHIFGYDEARVVERRAGRIPAGGVVHPWSAPGVMLVGDAAGVVSPATGGGIRLAFHFGRRAAHAIADHILHCGPAPEYALAPALPRFRAKRILRRALDLALPNPLIDLALTTPAMRWVASHLYFHRRGVGGIGFDAFQEQLPRWRPGEGSLRNGAANDAG
ncbi:MAG: NAD(P)/FAD-dependent oxidoreductase [Hyphomicrobiaceae bacterium]|nr:NAD(P)/FAD-dependent oxidoreductase [Hyphomicrobiaceae bacterium]